MTKNNKGRSGGDRPTPKTTDSRNVTPNRSSLKARIIRRGLAGCSTMEMLVCLAGFAIGALLTIVWGGV